MAEYKRIETAVPASFTESELKRAGWKEGVFFADFDLGKSGNTLMAIFSKPITTRLHELVTVTDLEPGQHLGVSRDHMIYEVFDSVFLRDHVFSLRGDERSVRHFRLLVRGLCIDVLSTEPPLIRLGSIAPTANP